MAEIRFEKVTKNYQQAAPAVDHLDFTCGDGEFLAILGPSGCGKSTTLRMLAGLEEITEGSIYIGGVKVNKIPSSKRNVAMSFENYGLYPDFTVYENIAYPLRIRKLGEEEIKTKVSAIAGKLRLHQVINNMPHSLSSGQKQRVSIARALVRNPSVTIMDEPLSHLDAKMRSYMRGVIKSLHQELGLTTVYVTHDQIEALTMADKILIMDGGRAQQIGTPDQVYHEPANLFVAGFVGNPQMNLISCGIVKHDGGYRAVHEGAADVDVTPYKGQITEGEKVVYGIRPEDVSVRRGAQPGYLKGIVYVVEPLGESTIISIRAGDEIIRAEVDGYEDGWNFDDVIYYRLNSARGHLFRDNSGERISG